jgi:hypothetical protein
MKIETKYNLRDEVFFIFENKCSKGYIQRIALSESVNVYDNSIQKLLFYEVAIQQEILKTSFKESKLFKTKQELIDNL